MSDKIAKGWTVKQFADHYFATLNTPMVNGVHRSPIFGDAKNILLIATIRFGQAKAFRVFNSTFAKTKDKLAH